MKYLISSLWIPSVIHKYSWWICSTEAEVFNLQFAAEFWDLLTGWGLGSNLPAYFSPKCDSFAVGIFHLHLSLSLLNDSLIRFFTWHQNGSVNSWGKILPQGRKYQHCWREWQSNESIWAGHLQGRIQKAELHLIKLPYTSHQHPHMGLFGKRQESSVEQQL